MGNPKFYLHKTVSLRKKIEKDPSIEKEKNFRLPVYLNFPLNPGRFRVYTGITVRPGHWDDRKQEVNRKDNDRANLNQDLKDFLALILDIYRQIRKAGDQPTAKAMKIAVDIKNRGISNVELKKENGSNTFWSDADRYMNDIKNKMSKATMIAKKYAFDCLRKFEKQTGYSVEYEAINSEFYSRYLDFSAETLNLLNNSIYRNVVSIRTFLDYGFDNAWHRCTYQKTVQLPMRWDRIDVITLLPEELGILLNFQTRFSGRKKAVDIFLFCCTTGMRVSDAIALKPSNIIDEYIHFTIKKTRKAMRIPLTDLAKEIIARYDSPIWDRIFPPSYQIDSLRVTLKAAAKEAGLNREITKVRYQLAKRIETKVELHEMIGFHHAKRTAVSMLLQNGATRETVMKITGNNSETIDRYIRIEDEQLREQFLSSMDSALGKLKK